MKYTMSRDGKKRATIRFEERLTREELADLNRMAKALGYKSYREFAYGVLAGAQMSLMEQYETAEKNGWLDGEETRTSFKVTMGNHDETN